MDTALKDLIEELLSENPHFFLTVNKTRAIDYALAHFEEVPELHVLEDYLMSNGLMSFNE